LYSWLPGTGLVIVLTRPYDASYAVWNEASSPFSYWRSPSARNAVTDGSFSTRFDTATWRHVVAVTAAPGTHTVSPTAAITVPVTGGGGDPNVSTSWGAFAPDSRLS
jgi:hypothetical protein